MHCLKYELIYKRFTAFFLLALFFTQAFSQLFIIADYYHNTSQYAAVCENKAKPSMHCNGKCQMYKKINAEEKSDQQASNKKFIPFNTLILLDYFYSLDTIYFTDLNIRPVEHSLFFPPIHVFSIFHPPGNLVLA